MKKLEKFLGFILLIALCACQPIVDASNYIKDNCENELSKYDEVIAEAKARGIPLVEVVQTFCKIPEIVEIWESKKLSKSEDKAKVSIIKLQDLGQIRKLE